MQSPYHPPGANSKDAPVSFQCESVGKQGSLRIEKVSQLYIGDMKTSG